MRGRWDDREWAGLEAEGGRGCHRRFQAGEVDGFRFGLIWLWLRSTYKTECLGQ